MYALLTDFELQSVLRSRNESETGKKEALIKRLEPNDMHLNIEVKVEVQDDQILVCPTFDTYRDINAESPVPAISRLKIQEYLQRSNSHLNGKFMYEAGHLMFARFSCAGSFTYLRGQCKASTKKVTYIVDIKVSHQGTIEECHCECAAGSGNSASCKHVAVLLFAIHDLMYNKTMKLMTIKEPKKKLCHPQIAAQNLPSKRTNNYNYDPLRKSDIIDNYQDYVRNLVIGYGESSMPLLQIYEPANLLGIQCDHTYTCMYSSQKKKLHAVYSRTNRLK